MNTSHLDPLADLIARQTTPAERADRWAGRFLKLTLLLLFGAIGLFLAFLLEQSGLFKVPGLALAIDHWEYLAWGIGITLGASLLAGILKMSYEMTD